MRNAKSYRDSPESDVIRHRSLASRLRSKDSRAVLRGAVGKAFLNGSSSLAAYPTAGPVRCWGGGANPPPTPRG